jgi:hypothetical protein
VPGVRSTVDGLIKLAQKLGQLQPFMALSLPDCMHGWANLHILGQPNPLRARFSGGPTAWSTHGPGGDASRGRVCH